MMDCFKSCIYCVNALKFNKLLLIQIALITLLLQLTVAPVESGSSLSYNNLPCKYSADFNNYIL